MKHIFPGQSAFTLIEALLSTVILAVGGVVICELSRRCVINHARGWEYEQAYYLLDECLDRLAADQDRTWAGEETLEGDFQPRYPLFRFEIKIQPAAQKDFTEQNLYYVTATVFWEVSDRSYQVKTSTLMFDNS